MKVKWPRAIDNRMLGRLQIAIGILALIGLFAYYGSTTRPANSKSSTSQGNAVAAHTAPATDRTAPDQEPSTTTQTGSGQITQEQAAPAQIASEQAAPEQAVAAQSVPARPAAPAFQDKHYTIQPGDTLEAVFNRMQLPIGELYEILEADEPYLVIDVLQPGDELTFRLDAQNQLLALSLVVDPSKTVAYERADDGGFVYKETDTPTTWVTDVVHGEVNGSFYVSARKSGLSDNAVMTINQLLKNRLDFRRDLRAGDHFDVVMKRETIDGKAIGNNRLIAVRIQSYKQNYGAYLHTDGSYYDANGDNLTPALLRYPTRQHLRISSSFNPWRLNPVTKRYAPHNGVDFAAPKGTPVIATGDGRVTRVAVHRYAGKYLVIDEFGPYSTRYLHLSKILVHKGQHVKRGQVIALSGNTGRSTGPHLHYELHIKGKPVNPMTAKIPMLKSVPAREIAAYRQHVHALQELMAGSDTKVARHDDLRRNDQAKAGELKTASAGTEVPAG